MPLPIESVIRGNIQIRNLNGTLIASDGIVSSIDKTNLMDLIGFWDASTNLPYLHNSIGEIGNVYKCNNVGSVDFGAGVITFESGDLVYYDGFVWGKISANAFSSFFAINTYSFTATAGQTNFSLTYLPNQVSVYYNGSKLTNTQYDASNGSYIELLFSPLAGDIIIVDSYVNTLGIGGSGTSGSLAKWTGTSTLGNAVAGTDYVLPSTLNSYVPITRTLTINGNSFDLSADRSWSIISGVSSFNTRTGDITLLNTDVTGALLYTPENVSNKSNNTSLGTSSVLYPTQNAVKTYIDSVTSGGVILQGDWNASTNSPNISSTTTTGWSWRVAVAGTTNIGGITDWQVGDLVVKTATGWLKIDNTDSITSVFGRYGSIVAQLGDYTTSLVTEGTNLYYTDARVRAAITATSPISISSGLISISQANGSTNGYLSSTDWTMFNNKQTALTNPVTGTGTTNYLPLFTSSGQIGNSVIQQSNGNATPAIGSILQGGKVAYILQVGDVGYDANYVKGIIASNSDLSSSSVWADASYLIVTGATGSAIGTGNQNTINILAAVPTAGIAARLCGDYVNDGYSDWYLPSSGELNQLFINRVAIGGFGSGYYWSSTEVDFRIANVQDFGSGYQTGVFKYNPYKVRAIRSFSIPKNKILSIAGNLEVQTITLGTWNGSAIADAYISSSATWNAKQNEITLTTIGTSGAATLVGSTLNIPQYSGGSVTSVFGRTGAVVATSGDYTTSQVTEGTNLYYTDARARLSISGSTGISYNSTTGVITNSAPDQTVSLTGAGTTSISGTYPNFTITSNDQYVGTVTSVGITSTAAALSISNSPIVSNGNIGVNFSGNSGQYVAGDGSLVTFPSIISDASNLVTEIYNNTGATLTKGTIVYINGGQGNLPTVAKALATGDSTSAQTYGFINADVSDMNNGFVTIIGSLENMDTQAYANGTQLYLSGTTAGTYTSTKPQAPIHLVYVAIVVRSHPTQGVLEVKIQNGVEMDEIHDVQITSIANGNILQYDSTTSLWENVAGTTTNISEGTNLYFTDARARLSITDSVTGIDYNSTTGVFSTTSGYGIPTTASQANWDTAYTNRITSLTTTGSSGSATLVSNVLNIPTYTLTGLGGVGGSGTTNTLPKFTASSTLGNSNITDSGTLITLGSQTYISTGGLGIGTSTMNNSLLRVVSNITGSATVAAVVSGGSVQTDVTTSANYFQTSATVVASATVATVSHYTATQGTFNTGSTVTNQYGFFVNASLIGATSNYAFFSNMGASTGRWSFYSQGTASNYFAGSLGLGTTTLTGYTLNIGKTITGAVTSYAVNQSGIVQSDVTTATYGYRNQLQTAAAAFTLPNYYHFAAIQSTIGSTSAVTSQYGYFVDSTMIGATNNYGFYGNIASGTNRWNLYMAGTATNFLQGELQLGSGQVVSASVINTVTNKVKLIINGTTYYLLASTSGT